MRTIALMSVGSWFAGKELSSLFVADVEAQSSSQVGVFRVNLNDAAFSELKNELGSVRIKVTGMPLATFAQIIITRQADVFHAVSSRCTHEGFTVEDYRAQFGGLRCPQHTSLFKPDGSVIRGPNGSSPSTISPLTKYNTSFDGANIVAIEIPGLGFNITTAAVLNPANGSKRLRIEFPSVNNVSYSVHYRASLVSGTWARIPFALAIDGAATTEDLTGNNTKKTIFVDRTEQLGFYAVTRTS